MKKYTKPTVEVKTFASVNKIADVSTWLESDAAGKIVGAAGVSTASITSYVINSEYLRF